MRVLLDENLPHDLVAALAGHEVLTVQGLGWAGVKNGELLRRANGVVDAFITMDRKLERQQNLAVLPFGVVLVVARSNRVQDLLPLVSDVLETLARIRPGNLEQVGAYQANGAGKEHEPGHFHAEHQGQQGKFDLMGGLASGRAPGKLAADEGRSAAQWNRAA